MLPCTIAAPPLTPPFPDTSSLQSVTFPFCRGRMHDEITHRALGPLFIMHEWVYPLGAIGVQIGPKNHSTGEWPRRFFGG